MTQQINGNIEGIRNSLLEQIRDLYQLRMEADTFASFALLSAMAGFTGQIGREISVYLSRDGRVVDISIGDSGKVSMPNVRLVRNEDRLCGVRCIHTHPNGDGRLSSVDAGTLRSMRLDAMAALGVGPEGQPTNFYAGYLGDMDEAGSRDVLLYGPLRPYKLPQKALMREIYLADDRFKSSTKAVEEARPERAILVGLESDAPYDTLAELGELAATAGALVVGRATQRKRDIDNATYIGSGKAEELSLTASALEADLLIFDDELSPVQTRNLETITGVRVIDRTALILDIFARHAQSREGKLQVELAQLKYELPRIFGQGKDLSRQGSGTIARGPGETKLETDRRRIRERIAKIKKELDGLRQQRAFTRARRARQGLPVAALVGYTNAGKSTLLNALTRSEVLAEDKLFATLDPTTRRLRFPEEHELVLADTVGFIRNLPKELTEAFQATLEELEAADLLLHVADASHPELDRQIAAVDGILADMELNEVPRILILNKWDRLEDEMRDILRDRWPDALPISAETRDGLNALSRCIENTIHWETTANIEITGPMPKVY